MARYPERFSADYSSNLARPLRAAQILDNESGGIPQLNRALDLRVYLSKECLLTSLFSYLFRCRSFGYMLQLLATLLGLFL